jgi:hypothetical protein
VRPYLINYFAVITKPSSKCFRRRLFLTFFEIQIDKGISRALVDVDLKYCECTTNFVTHE